MAAKPRDVRKKQKRCAPCPTLGIIAAQFQLCSLKKIFCDNRKIKMAAKPRDLEKKQKFPHYSSYWRILLQSFRPVAPAV